jgi:hypothetical protein
MVGVAVYRVASELQNPGGNFGRALPTKVMAVEPAHDPRPREEGVEAVVHEQIHPISLCCVVLCTQAPIVGALVRQILLLDLPPCGRTSLGRMEP